MGNSEVLLREALMGAEELGIETEILCLLDVDVKPCLGCKICPAEIKNKEACIIKDDAVFVWNKIMDCDGLIISGPVYCLTPPGYLLQIRDRLFASRSDVAWMMERKKLKAQGEKVFVDESFYICRRFRYTGLAFSGTILIPHDDFFDTTGTCRPDDGNGDKHRRGPSPIE
jgi:multimeric flavodoxin WrbA